MGSIKAYQLGMAQHGKIPEPSLPNFSFSLQNHAEVDNFDGNFCREKSKILEEEIVKLQAVVIDIVERVQLLENDKLSPTQQQRNAISGSSGSYNTYLHKKRRVSAE